MRCPNCKTGHIREEKNEFREKSLKCDNCSREYELNESNHLVPLNRTNQKKVLPKSSLEPPTGTVEAAAEHAAHTHTAELMGHVDPPSQKSLANAAVIAKQSLKQQNDTKGRGHRLNDADRDTIFTRLVKGDRPEDIAIDIPCSSYTVYKYRKDNLEKLTASGMKPIKGIYIPKPLTKKERLARSGRKGATIQLLARVRKGEISPEASIKALEKYQCILKEDIAEKMGDIRQKQVEIKHIDNMIYQIKDSKQQWEGLCTKI